MVFIPPYESKIWYVYELWEEKRKQLGWKPFSYYRTPADQEGLEKMLYLSFYSLKYGVGAGVFDGFAVSHATTLRHYLGRIGYWTAPGLVSCGAFVATNHVLAKTTGKDTVYNHMASAVVAASVWGAKFNSYMVGVPLALGLVVMCGVKKLTVDAGMATMAGDTPKYPEYWYFAQKNDLSIMKE
uniref:NADH dehydrogenase [ubiquinone] 1 alpha subcomplex subunit 11 n=1 Tax=Rhipicephalus appendiculatus TaxID=34631 RepID=A0A131YRA7_RHIAP